MTRFSRCRHSGSAAFLRWGGGEWSGEAGAAALFFSQTKKDHHSYAGVAGMESETAPYEKTKQTFKVPMKCQVRVDKCLSSTSVVSENSIAN